MADLSTADLLEVDLSAARFGWELAGYQAFVAGMLAGLALAQEPGFAAERLAGVRFGMNPFAAQPIAAQKSAPSSR
jgi:hypothetical protein